MTNAPPRCSTWEAAPFSRAKLRRLVRRFFLKLNRAHRHHGRDRMFVNQLGLTVAAQQHAEIVEPSDIALQLYAIDQKDRDGGFAFADRVEKRVLQVLLFFTHGFAHCYALQGEPWSIRRSITIEHCC